MWEAPFHGLEFCIEGEGEHPLALLPDHRYNVASTALAPCLCCQGGLYPQARRLDKPLVPQIALVGVRHSPEKNNRHGFQL